RNPVAALGTDHGAFQCRSGSNPRTDADLFLSTILEGPHDWPVRPVAEIVYEREFGRAEIKSALVGAIWQIRDDLAVDVGLRGGRINDHTLAGIRAGLTFSFVVASAPAEKTEGGGR